MKELRKKLLAVIALLLVFSLVFTGCEQDDDRDDRDRDEREEERDDRDDRDEDEDEDKDEDKDEDGDEADIMGSEPAYHMESVELLTEEYYYDGDGNLITAYHYDYDGYGNLVETSSVNAEGKVTSRSVYGYDAAGNHIYTENYYNDGSLGSTAAYTYDENGLCTSEVYEILSAEMVLTTVYEYDAQGYLIRALETDAEGNFRGEVVYTYNGDHTERYTEEFDTDRDGNRRANGGAYDLYDADGNLIYWCTYGSGDNMASKDDPAYQGECFYDENGRLVEETFSELGGYIVSKDTLTYDANGNLVYQERIYISSGNVLNHYEYTYETMTIKVEGN